MFYFIDDTNKHKYPEILDKMFRLRAYIFYDLLSWNVKVKDGKERDFLDDANPVYIVFMDINEIRGCMRLLPLNGPTLLRSFFADTLPKEIDWGTSNVWEVSRFCVTDTYETEITTKEMIIQLGEWALLNKVDFIVTNFDEGVKRLYRRLGLKLKILGSTIKYGSKVYLGKFPVTEELLRKMKGLV